MDFSQAVKEAIDVVDKKIICPKCGREALEKRDYKKEVLYVHEKKKGLFGFTEVKGCNYKRIT